MGRPVLPAAKGSAESVTIAPCPQWKWQEKKPKDRFGSFMIPRCINNDLSLMGKRVSESMISMLKTQIWTFHGIIVPQSCHVSGSL